MGIWGPKLYQDDLAEDIKLEYEELLKKEMSNEKIIESMCLKYKEEIEDSDEKPIFWMVLADILCENKKLTSFVKDKALKEIESGENLQIWREQASKEDYIKRKQEIDNLRRKLVEYQNEELDVLKGIVNSQKSKNCKRNEWEIGDTFAYKIENTKKYNGQYLILRKIDEYENNKIYQSAVIYVQITSNKKIPKNEKEINKLDYIIIGNQGNVRHEYRMILKKIPYSLNKSKLIYIGNFKNICTPKDEYIELNIWKHPFDDIEYLVSKEHKLGTSKNPIYYEVNPKNISDSHVRFLMRVKYYKEVLGIEPPDDAIVKNDPLLFISLVDSLMIGGFVRNPVGIVTEELKQETYKRINELRDIINSSNTKDQEERITILNEFEEKVRNYNTMF